MLDISSRRVSATGPLPTPTSQVGSFSDLNPGKQAAETVRNYPQPTPDSKVFKTIEHPDTSRQGSAASALPRVTNEHIEATSQAILGSGVIPAAAKPAPLVRPPQHALTSRASAKASPAPKPYEEICRRWLAETVQAAPERHHRDPYEVVAEALPELVRRLST